MNRVLVATVLLLAGVSPAAGQSDGKQFQLGAQFATYGSQEFNETDTGGGIRFSWHPASFLGVESEFIFYPGDFTEAGAFSRRRIEGLFGVTVGPVLGRFRPSAKLRSGYLTFSEARAPFACIAIFPPPLQCRLGGGASLPAYEIGGAAEWYPTEPTVVRVDLSDRLVKYPATVLDSAGTIHDDPFLSHDFRFTIGGGVRF